MPEQTRICLFPQGSHVFNIEAIKSPTGEKSPSFLPSLPTYLLSLILDYSLRSFLAHGLLNGLLPESRGDNPRSPIRRHFMRPD